MAQSDELNNQAEHSNKRGRFGMNPVVKERILLFVYQLWADDEITWEEYERAREYLLGIQEDDYVRF